jgi:hypothetical protein
VKRHTTPACSSRLREDNMAKKGYGIRPAKPRQTQRLLRCRSIVAVSRYCSLVQIALTSSHDSLYVVTAKLL